MAAVQPAGPLPRMMTLECLGLLAVIVFLRVCRAAFAGLAMSYRNGKAPRQAGSKAKPVHKLTPGNRYANFCLYGPDSRNIIAWAANARY
jgi:hypothetical protein